MAMKPDRYLKQLLKDRTRQTLRLLVSCISLEDHVE
jgi:hypothetical protein